MKVRYDIYNLVSTNVHWGKKDIGPIGLFLKQNGYFLNGSFDP